MLRLKGQPRHRTLQSYTKMVKSITMSSSNSYAEAHRYNVLMDYDILDAAC